MTHPGQLVLDLDPHGDDLDDLDLDHARTVLAAEEETTGTPRPCRCVSRSMYTITAHGELVCLKCGRRW